MIGSVVILALGIALIVYFVGIYNGLVNLSESVKVAWANIDVLLKQRHDELPKLVETCKRYMQFEQETLEKVMRARASVSQASESGNVAAVGAAEQRVAGVLGMRHQAENGAGLVENAGNRARRAVEVGPLVALAARSAIAEGDEAARFETVERLGICGVIAVVMSDRHPNCRSGFVAAGKDRLVVLDAQINIAAGESQRAVRQ